MAKFVALALLLLVACGPDTGGRADAVPGCQNLCSSAGWQQCRAGGTYADPVACAEDQVCSPNFGCVACPPNGTYCEGNDVYQCNATGTDGDFSLTCPAGNVCAGGECKTPCEQASEEPSNVGCEFWAVDLDNEYFSGLGFLNDAAGAPFAVVLANNNDTAASVRITQNAARYGLPVTEADVQTVVVPPRGVTQVNLPQREIDGTMGQNGPYVPRSGSGSFVSSHGFHLVSTLPIVAYQFNPIEQQYSNDASILLPQQALGLHYYIFSWETANPCGDSNTPDIPDHTSITIVGTQPGTTVTVRPTHDVVAAGGDTGLPIPRIPAGQEFSFSLGPYDVVNLESFQPTGNILECLSQRQYNGDFTGTLVTSSHPIAVFSGAERVSTQGGAMPAPEPPPDYDPNNASCTTDHLEDQMLPTRALGREFAIARSPVRSTGGYREPDIYRVLATVPNTTVTTNLAGGLASFQLNEGEFRTFPATDGFVLTSNEPIMLGQVLVSRCFTDNGAAGDATLVMIPAVEQLRKEYAFLVPATFDTDYIALAKPTNATVFVDGQPLSNLTGCRTGPIGTVGTVAFEQITCPINDGPHTLGSNVPVGLYVYGYYTASSYGFAGGSDLKIINPVE